MTESLLLQAQKIAEMVSQKVDKIDIVYLYGGVAQGRSHARSDLDMVAVCDGISVRWQFIMDDRPVNLHSMTWKQLEDTAKGLADAWSVTAGSIVHTKVLWSKSRDMEERFERIQGLTESGGPTAFQRAINSFDSLYGKLWRLQRSIESVDRLDSRFLIWDIANGLVNILAALNNQPLLNNWGKQLHEIEMLEKKPKEFARRYERFVTVEPQDALSIGANLVDEMSLLIREWLTNKRQPFDSDVKEIVISWPTNLEYLNKAFSAIEKNDFPAGYYAASDNAEFNVWAFTLLQRIAWDRRSFFSTNDSISCLPEEVKKHICTLLQSRELTELHTAAKRLTEILSNELVEAGWTLPFTNSLDDALRFLFTE